MHFDNSNKVIKLSKRKYIALLIYLILMGVLILSDVFGNRILGYDKSIFIGSFTALYILYVVYAYLSNYNYFVFNDEGEKLTFRFASLRPFDNKKQAIEIPKTSFKGYKFKNSFFKLRQEIILHVKTNNGIASYPPISIRALSINQRKMLVSSLNQYV
ncbi:MAG TPA: hypothetical protein DCG75_04440 [Bacteroidales bacterium]|jgi:hypothetical protein|nr:hypothetical protein [Bacteroidales bacterium]